jgi:plastocyanin
MQRATFNKLGWLALWASCASLVCAQEPAVPMQNAEVTAKLTTAQISGAHQADKARPAVIWLNPLRAGVAPAVTPGTFTMMQKNKMFMPRLLVVPVGSSVAFPNADPFFHNVFSLFDGRRFDLGLYEAGSTRSVVFSREGVSYIFCNIHSDMSAVVIALATPYYGLADQQGVIHVKDVPDGDYEMHIWIEGQEQKSLDQLTRRVHISGEATDLGIIRSDHPNQQPHLNKFGQPYEPDAHPIY